LYINCWQYEFIELTSKKKGITMICPECHGSTYCPECHGLGYYGGVMQGVIEAVANAESSECENCGGDKKCPTCGGSGEVEEEEG
jgi:hypothetical protein